MKIDDNKVTEVAYLAPDIVLRMIINDKENLLDSCLKQKNIKVVTSAFCFYEALSSLTKEEMIKNIDKIYQLLTMIPITDLKQVSGKFYIEDKKRISHLRKIALREEDLHEIIERREIYEK
jgi:hypothetical protein